MEPRSDALPADPGVKPFLDHLEDLRRMLIQCIVSLALGILAALPFAPGILSLLKKPLSSVVENPDRFLRSLEVVGAFAVTLRIAFWGGLLLSTPLLLFFVGRFVFAGFTERERSVVLRSLGFAVALFVLGVCIAYFITLPIALGVMFRLHDWLGVRAEWIVTSYVAFAVQLLIGFGLAFEMPVVVLILGRLGILTSSQLRSKRRHVIILLLVVAMILTPPDLFTQLIMALPLIVLYEFCIWIVRFFERRRATM